MAAEKKFQLHLPSMLGCEKVAMDFAADDSMKVGISLTVDEDRLQIAVQDKGAGIGQVPTPDIDNKIEGKSAPRGWGIFLIESLMDEVTFESTPEGNVVKMIIHLEK